VTVGEICTLGLGDGEDGSKWRRRLLAWKEEQIGECSMLTNIFLEDGVENKWLESRSRQRVFRLRSLSLDVFYGVA
jgi:hypothetical protein